MTHDIDEASLFAQDCTTKIVAALASTHWDQKTQTSWSINGYKEILRYCLEDSTHDFKHRQKAIEHCIDLIVGNMQRYENHLKKIDIKNGTQKHLNWAREQINIAKFIENCHKREQEILEINNEIFQELNSHVAVKMKLK